MGFRKAMLSTHSLSIRPRRTPRAVCGWLAVVLLASQAHAATAVTGGSAAPDFALRTFSGQNLRLSEFRGNVVAISFWATWCGPCQQEMTRLEDLHGRYEKAGLVTLGINLDDDRRRAETMVQRLALTYPQLVDRAKDVARLYEVDSTPFTVFIDREGVVRHVHQVFRTDDTSVYLDQLRQLIDE